MRFRPFSPLEFNLSTGLDLGRDGTILSILVADDVAARVAAAVDETQIGSGFRPTDAVRRAAHVRVLVDKVSSVVFAINNGTRHKTVTSDQSGRAEKSSCNLRDRHVVGFCWIVQTINAQRNLRFESNERREKE